MRNNLSKVIDAMHVEINETRVRAMQVGYASSVKSEVKIIN